MDLHVFNDIHTHNLSAGDDAVINLDVSDDIPSRGHFSVGIHPWHTPSATQASIELLKTMAADNRIVAIGETGLDARRGGPVEDQKTLFLIHADISETLRKPLIIHAVHTFPLLIALKRKVSPSQRWIIHGFRGKPQLAKELLDHGFDISIGEHFNPRSAAIIPKDRLFTETDMSALPISEIRSRLGL